jgi:hypothetical protein
MLAVTSGCGKAAAGRMASRATFHVDRALGPLGGERCGEPLGADLVGVGADPELGDGPDQDPTVEVWRVLVCSAPPSVAR